MSRFDDAIATVLRHEGGFVDHPHDPGGATAFGVSLRTLKALEGDRWDLDADGDVDADDVRLITEDNARSFYRRHFWFDELESIHEQIIATKIFDIAVNAGRRRATLLAQRAVNWFDPEIIVDGWFGPQTVAKINAVVSTGTVKLHQAIQAEQARFYVELVNAKRSREVFLLGWLNRAFDVG